MPNTSKAATTWGGVSGTFDVESCRLRQYPCPDCLLCLYYYVFGLFKNTVVIQQIYARWKQGFSKDERFSALIMGVHALSNLAVLHGIDIYSTGLINLGKPEGYIQRQVDGWYRRYQNSQTDNVPVFEQVYQWLVKNLPNENSPTLIHNDYKYDNVVLNANDLTDIVAVLDWEMTTIGDPLMDVGTSLSYWSEATDGAFEKSFNLTWLPGNLNRQEFADRYAQQSGRDLSNILYYYVFGLFKNTVLVLLCVWVV